MENSIDVTTLFLCDPCDCELLLEQLKNNKVIRRSLLYFFYWGRNNVTSKFKRTIEKPMKISTVTNPRHGVFRIYYNQASTKYDNQLKMVNWWTGRLFSSPALPPADAVYNNFNGQIFKVPVFHAPPWHFVHQYNKSVIEVTGGRDHKLLILLAEKLNFRYEYFDPPDRSQGSGVGNNGSFKGVLGIIQRREADFFLGDVTVTWERQLGVEFSVFTLADSGAFITHAPRRLSETFALLRPFKWQVWPAVLATVVISGPTFWAAASGSALWRPLRSPPAPTLSTCVWFITSIFLRQSGRSPSNSGRARALVLLLSLAATYVLAGVYSATLTSLLAKPAREPPLVNLFALERAMIHSGYSLFVERHSSSLAILQNGTGVYGRLWNLMRRQRIYAVKSVEQGVRKMLQTPDSPVALLAGRETLFFNSKRFGVSSFQLSEKLYTRYSAIAMQQGCPYLNIFNKVLMQLFEAGILTKITLEEYEKLRDSGMEVPSTARSTGTNEDKVSKPNSNENLQKLEPINMRMLQGAFYVLIFGYIISGVALFVEFQKKNRAFVLRKKLKFSPFERFESLKGALAKFKSRLRTRWRAATALSEVSIDFVE
ncbi:ionotropic receptor 40a-like [Arctopsyche grandis]|uniref:ionotropic receptor 40a-like n=1 Tax=Arctopsyche grandis TaxID=121162 RepID=UPI00406D6CDC